MSFSEIGTYTKIEQIAVSLPDNETEQDQSSTTEDTNGLMSSPHTLPEYSDEPSPQQIEQDLLAFYPGYNGRLPFMPDGKPYQSPAKVLLMVSILTCSTLSMATIIGPVSIFYMYCFPHLVFRMMKGFCHYWCLFFIFLMTHVLRVKLVVTGHKGRFKPRSLIIINHLSHFDWFWFLAYVVRAGRIIDLAVVLKHEIKFVPILGWASQTMGFIFIRRNWESDQEYMRKYITIYNMYDDNFHLLLFPEGADYNRIHLYKSIKFAAKNNLPQQYYTLHPRLKGFKLVVEMMRKRGIDAVYDVTIGYPKDISKEESDFFKGHVPQEVHCHVSCFDASEIPAEEEALGVWCQERWRVKDKRMEGLFKKGVFTEDPMDPHEQLNGAIPIRNTSESNVVSLGGVLFSLVLMSVAFTLYFYCNTLWHSVFWMVFFTSLNYLPTNGLDGYMQWCHKNMIKRSKYK